MTAELFLTAYVVYIYITNLIIVNNYEISEWQYYYLSIWSKNKSQPFISADKLLEILGLQKIPLFSLFFAPFDGEVDISVFLEFICIFTFFSNPFLIPLIFSIIDIKSNRVINEGQVKRFFRCLGIASSKIQFVNQWLNIVERDNNDYISLSSFYELINHSENLFLPLHESKIVLIEKIIGYENYNIIIKRRSFYRMYRQNNNNNALNDMSSLNSINRLNSRIILPQERCYEKLYRVLINHKPNPYYCDYLTCDFQATNEIYLYHLRQRYGYSKRLNPSFIKSGSMSRRELSARSKHVSLQQSSSRKNNKIGMPLRSTRSQSNGRSSSNVDVNSNVNSSNNINITNNTNLSIGNNINNNVNNNVTPVLSCTSINHNAYCNDNKSVIKSIENTKPSISNGVYYSHFSNKVLPVEFSIKNV